MGTTLEDLRAFPEEVRLESGVYALHAFQKKWHQGSTTDQRDLELIKRRLSDAEKIDRARREKAGRKSR